jgi:hypothetical protein
MPRARARDEVILKVLADLGGVDDEVDAVGCQVVGRSDAAQHQQLRGVDRAAGRG